MNLPDTIILQEPHAGAGTVLKKYIGVTYSIEKLPGFVEIFRSGDYVGHRCHLTEDWLIKNPNLWKGM